MQAFFIPINVCRSWYYRFLQVWYHFQPTDLNLVKSHTNPGKRKQIKLFFYLATPVKYILKAKKKQIYVP